MTTTHQPRPSDELAREYREAIARLAAERDAINVHEPGKRKANEQARDKKQEQLDGMLERYYRFLQHRELENIVRGDQ